MSPLKWGNLISFEGSEKTATQKLGMGSTAKGLRMERALYVPEANGMDWERWTVVYVGLD
jgi:hypothetical protein